jgi:REP element-mobilizing transposase RayT
MLSTYAITTVTAQRRALFTRTSNADLLIEIIFHYRDQGRYALHGFAIMTEHIHILLIPAIGQTIERCAQCIKGGFSHALPQKFPVGVWQPSFTNTASATPKTSKTNSPTSPKIPPAATSATTPTSTPNTKTA